MHDKKTIRILKNLDPKDLTSLKKYLAFRFPSKDTPAHRLFLYIYSCKHNWKSPKLKIERVKNHLGKDYTDNKFAKTLTALVKEIEGFFVYQQMNKPENQFDYYLYLGAAYKEKGLYKDFRQAHQELDRAKKKMPSIDLDYHLNLLKQWHQLFYSSQKLTNEQETLEHIKLELSELYKTQNLYYELETINKEKNNEQKSKQTIQIEKSALSEVLEHLKILLEAGNSDSFDYLKDIVEHQLETLSTEMAYVLLTHLLNACNKYIRGGNMDAVKTMSYLYNHGIENNILLYNGKVSERTFLNIIDCHSKTKHSPKIPTIIKNCETFANSEDYTSLSNLAYAIYYFSIDQYRRALDYINKEIVKNNLDTSIRLNVLYVCSTYSDDFHHQNSDTIINNAQRSLNKFKGVMPPEQFKSFHNLFRIIRKLWKPNPNYPSIIKFYHSCKYLSSRAWVKKQLPNLPNNGSATPPI